MKKISSFDINVYLPFTKSTIQTQLTYKLAFISWIFSNFLQISIAYYLWKSIFDSSEQGLISGFTFLDMQTYIVMGFITRILISGQVEWILAEEIGDGSIAVMLLKPINYFLRLIFESLGSFLILLIAVAIPAWSFLVIFNRFVYDIPFPNISYILLFMLSVLLSCAISFLINFCIGLTTFFITYIWGVLLCKESIFMLLSGSLVPITMFPEFWQNILTYLPFASLNFIPVMIYMQKFGYSQIFYYLSIQIFWVVALTILVSFLWKLAIKKLSVAGG